MYDINRIKQRINCVTYAQRFGLPITKSGDRCISPLRAGAKNPTSFIVMDDFYYDYSAGQGGDVIELCAALAHNGDRGAAIRDLASITGVASDKNENTAGWIEYTNHMNAMTAFYHSQLTEEDRKYLRSRGITDEDTDRLMIGRVTDGNLKGRLFLPYIHPNGYVCYYATRALPEGTFPENKYMKQHKDEHSQHIPWGLNTLNRENDTLVIAEGYFDAASYECAGYPVISAITGFFSKDQIPTVIAVARKFKRVFIVYDDDSKTSNAGAKFTEKMSHLLIQNRIPFIVGTVPPPYHDISEYYAAGGDLRSIIDNAEHGISYIASRFDDFSELERFIYTVARHTKRTELETIFAAIRSTSRWNDAVLKSLLKSATTAPPENIIADEILAKHQLVYIPAIGFYEYTSGAWRKTSDDRVGAYLDRAYGEFSTNQRITATTGLLRRRALREDITFDNKPVWNFVNGTLELDTGVFRDHNPNDYCSIQATYPYNPEATYTAWAQFIEDITMGDPRASEILQFFPGYVLFPTCEHEKIFIFSGEGGNGKTRYITVLQRLFGEENVSHVTPQGLLQPFQLIQLKASILNMAGEIKGNLTECEEIIKLLSSGEPVSACFKGKDFVNFVSRSKLAYATNKPLKSGDTSDALTRRFVMVDFKAKFVDDPDPNNPYERKKNIYILDSLTEELDSGGIFNWVYEGYQLLRAVGYFTETHDQAELIQDFKRASNPVLMFWEDIQNDIVEYKYMGNPEVYRRYQHWCLDNGEKPATSNAFHAEFKKVAKQVLAPVRSKKERGYRLI